MATTTTTSADQLLPMITSDNRLDVIKFGHKMTYDKYSTRVECTTRVVSNNFKPPGKCGPEYFLRFQPNTASSIHLYLHLVASKQNTHLESTTSVLDRNGKKYLSNVFTYSGVISDKSYKIFHKSRAEVMDNSKGLLQDDKLTFFCEFTFTVESSDDKIEFVSGHFNRMNDELGRLLTDGNFSDLQLVVGEKQFQAHKCILAARSPVFSSMFEHDTKEKQEINRVEITDVNSDVFAEVLRYIYTGKVESLDKYCAELLVAADKYQLVSLKRHCDQFNPKTVADLNNEHKLKQNALDYFRKNTLGNIQTMFESNKTEALVKALRDLTLGNGKVDGSSIKD